MHRGEYPALTYPCVVLSCDTIGFLMYVFEAPKMALATNCQLCSNKEKPMPCKNLTAFLYNCFHTCKFTYSTKVSMIIFLFLSNHFNYRTALELIFNDTVC